MPIHELKEQITRLPEQPGVYLYFNEGGDTIYVGKARALRDRVRNYLGAYGLDPKTDALLDEVVRLRAQNAAKTLCDRHPSIGHLQGCLVACYPVLSDAGSDQEPSR